MFLHRMIVYFLIADKRNIFNLIVEVLWNYHLKSILVAGVCAKMNSYLWILSNFISKFNNLSLCHKFHHLFNTFKNGTISYKRINIISRFFLAKSKEKTTEKLLYKRRIIFALFLHKRRLILPSWNVVFLI